MATIKPLYFTWEQNDGSILGPIRVLAADKISAEGTCRKQRWGWDDNPRTHCLMGFYAARRTGSSTAEDFDAFMAQLVDFKISNDTDDDDEAQDDDENPTVPGSSY